jgi:hypothetical protein
MKYRRERILRDGAVTEKQNNRAASAMRQHFDAYFQISGALLRTGNTIRSAGSHIRPMTRNPELALYPRVSEWLARSLRGRHPRAEVAAFDTHSTDLAAFLRKEGLHSLFSDCDAYEIQVDVTGIVKTQKTISLAFIECKIGPITLRDVGQLLGYSLVARPEWSFLVSPKGLSGCLHSLLVTYGRQDILQYGRNRSMRLATWNVDRAELDPQTVLPRGHHF